MVQNNRNTIDKTALNVREVAGLLSVDSKTIYRLAQKGELPGFKVAGAWRFLSEDIDEWIEKKKQRYAKQLVNRDG